MADRLRVLLEGGAFFESPRWHEGRWWVSDFYRHTVSTVDASGREEAVLEVEGSDEGFLVFREATTERMNVLFKRKDGNLGLIEPEA